MKSPSLGRTEIQILMRLLETQAHVRALRRALEDNGAVSAQLRHLEQLRLVVREKKKGRVVNSLTPKGRNLAKLLKSLPAS
jgi:DNA-binding HxlR family transcriptional regulator